MLEMESHLTWSPATLGELLPALAQTHGWSLPLSEQPLLRLEENPTESVVTHALTTLTAASTVEVVATPVAYPAVADFLRTTAPAILPMTTAGQTRFVALIHARGHHVTILGSDRRRHRVTLDWLSAALCQALEAPHLPRIEQLLTTAALPPARRAQARQALLRERLRTAALSAWVLQLAPGSPFGGQLRHAGVARHLALLLLTHLGQFSLWLLAWWWIGRGIFAGQTDRTWLFTVALLLATVVPLRLLTLWVQGVIGVKVGALLQQRLLAGALQLAPDEIRHMGVGQLLGRIYEAEHFETLVFSNGPLALIALVELVLSAWVLANGASGGLHLALLSGWLIVAGGMCYRFYCRYGRWTTLRHILTHDLVEKMVGHRTRLVQSPPEQWHIGEASALQEYRKAAQEMEQAGVLVAALSARGWLLLGLATLLPTLLGQELSPARLAVSLGGVLGVEAALRQLTLGATNLLSAAVVWEQITFLFHAASRPQERALQLPQPVCIPPVHSEALLSLHNLHFHYDRGGPLLHNLQLQIATGDRLLLTGASGSGKSTLAALLTGLRVPTQGRLCLYGLDRQQWGHLAWQRRIAAAPQFHENYVLSAPLLFNLLLGRRWPPCPEDIQAAAAICDALGLGDLLARMPSGLWQMVGETGWQLSHGERSRLYVARALLQEADLIVLDESFAALDPETLMQVLACVLERAPTLLVIAHR